MLYKTCTRILWIQVFIMIVSCKKLTLIASGLCRTPPPVISTTAYVTNTTKLTRIYFVSHIQMTTAPKNVSGTSDNEDSNNNNNSSNNNNLLIVNSSTNRVQARRQTSHGHVRNASSPMMGDDTNNNNNALIAGTTHLKDEIDHGQNNGLRRIHSQGSTLRSFINR